MALNPHNVASRADFECSCFSYEGIDAVKESLRTGTVKPWLSHLYKITISGIAAGNPEILVRIKLIAPPVYVMICSTPPRRSNRGLQGGMINGISEYGDDTNNVLAAEEKIKGSGSNFVMQMASKAMQTYHVIETLWQTSNPGQSPNQFHDHIFHVTRGLILSKLALKSLVVIYQVSGKRFRQHPWSGLCTWQNWRPWSSPQAWPQCSPGGYWLCERQRFQEKMHIFQKSDCVNYMKFEHVSS